MKKEATDIERINIEVFPAFYYVTNQRPDEVWSF